MASASFSSCFGRHSFAFCTEECKLGVVQVHRFAPRFVIASFEVCLNVHKRNKLISIMCDRVLSVARKFKCLWNRDVVAWLA
eukprot:6214105-Pleurochrysis_carterae.AAC.8